ncbi:MAG: phosphatidylserine decarboxylase [Thermoplasmata archaeon]|nr:phosphatidylserine decarboxylase [Thermoplasmata archaeon]MCI4356920.1 phosphatidylserine decarboxylase [Thermoplasmata archaeon]
MFAPAMGRYLGVLGAMLAVVTASFALGYVPRGGLTLIAALAIAWAFFAFFLWFFRDPERVPGPGIVSPADGKVIAVGPDGERTRIAVFMNVTDVHVNRFPLEGTVASVEDGGAGFRPAFHPDAIHNVWRKTTLDTAVGAVDVVQMTGILARRIVSFVGPGDHGAKGDRLGMIVLGSRVDLLFDPARARPTVKVGDRVTAGRTRVAREVGS